MTQALINCNQGIGTFSKMDPHVVSPLNCVVNVLFMMSIINYSSSDLIARNVCVVPTMTHWSVSEMNFRGNRNKSNLANKMQCCEVLICDT